MASIETSQNDNEDTVLSITKDIRDLLRHQEGRIKRLEDDHAPTLPESSLKLSKAEKCKQLDIKPLSNDDVDEAEGPTQPTEDQTAMKLSLPLRHLDGIASTTSSSAFPPLQSDSSQLEMTITTADPRVSEICK
jgi:hypothetical protein